MIPSLYKIQTMAAKRLSLSRDMAKYVRLTGASPLAFLSEIKPKVVSFITFKLTVAQRCAVERIT
jgi:hypothetical protein